MTDNSHHTQQEIHHGHPTWIDLSTHDLSAARDFYSALFGWNFVDQGEDFGGYHMIFKDDREIGGAMSSLMGPEGPTEEPQGPTAWTVYLRADNIDVAVEAAVTNGADIMVAPMHVGDAGRMAVVVDPTGAVVGLWEAGTFPGFSKAARAGMPVWFDLVSNDPATAERFYEKVAGWDLVRSGDGNDAEHRYTTNGPPEIATAGIGAAPVGVDSSYWRLYLDVDDTDAAVRRIRELGGALLDGPMDSPYGRVSTVADPQGASFQIIQS